MPQKQKLSIEEKVKLIQDYLRGKIGLREAAPAQAVSCRNGEYTAKKMDEIERGDAFQK